MKQYRITSADLTQDSPDDCYLDPNDPIHEIKQLSYLAGLGAQARLEEYRASNNDGSNISVTGMEKQELEKKHNIKPGTDEWFRLWFSKPYLTCETPIKDSKK
jgi:hypothetical protein